MRFLHITAIFQKHNHHKNERDKFPGKRMVWLGHSELGTTKLVTLKGNMNGQVYQDKVLRKAVLEDVLQRKKSKGMQIN